MEEWTSENSLISEQTDYPADTSDIQEPTNPENDSSTGLGSSCIMRVVIESGDAVLGEVVSNQNQGHVEAAETFSVPEVLQQTQLVAEPYESTVNMEGIVENISERKT
ncbi:zinc finger and BTB domain-containing protein 48-like protein [Lates japonicus]|uniref:Zinc finger and BTB domain-containing protein 48-like protein n=1 Tax=Lates japonicus TaxID=270547 RepID=A0AAD3MAW6_LATJO|nr:zinc finger and BTB domain-containing protein 48-like protein [Lates japonicus]